MGVCAADMNGPPVPFGLTGRGRVYRDQKDETCSRGGTAGRRAGTAGLAPGPVGAASCSAAWKDQSSQIHSTPAARVWQPHFSPGTARVRRGCDRSPDTPYDGAAGGGVPRPIPGPPPAEGRAPISRRPRPAIRRRRAAAAPPGPLCGHRRSGSARAPGR